MLESLPGGVPVQGREGGDVVDWPGGELGQDVGLFSERRRPNRAFHQVIVYVDSAIFEIDAKQRPIEERAIDGLPRLFEEGQSALQALADGTALARANAEAVRLCTDWNFSAVTSNLAYWPGRFFENLTLSARGDWAHSLKMDVVNPNSITISMKDSKKPWYQLKDSETKWYHHLMHGRVLIMLVLMAIVCLLAIGVGIYSLFGN